MTRFSIHHPHCVMDHHDGICMDASGMLHRGFPQMRGGKEPPSQDIHEKAEAALTKQLMIGLLRLLGPLDSKRIQKLLAEDGVHIKWIELGEYLELCRNIFKVPPTIEAEAVSVGEAQEVKARLSTIDSSGTMWALPPAPREVEEAAKERRPWGI